MTFTASAFQGAVMLSRGWNGAQSSTACSAHLSAEESSAEPGRHYSILIYLQLPLPASETGS